MKKPKIVKSMDSLYYNLGKYLCDPKRKSKEVLRIYDNKRNYTLEIKLKKIKISKKTKEKELR